MALRYSADFLLHLRESPLCARPDGLPPAEEWMGASLEQLRIQSKSTVDNRRGTNDTPLLDQTNRRSGSERHAPSRNSANPDDIVFGPPRMAFSSARGNRMLENEKGMRDADAQGRTDLRSRSGETDVDRLRDSRNTNLRRGDADQDSDGWSTVKPRKSFGTEGAERFHGKMGGGFRDERRPTRDRDDRDATRDRQARPFDNFARGGDVAADGGEGRSRNGLNRNKLDTWRPGDAVKDSPLPTEKRDRDRTKSWRDRDSREPEPSDDRGGGRAPDRRWGRDRDQRVERDPEWLDEPQVEQREAHTQQDFQKWMEQMKAAKSGASAASKPAATAPTEAVAEASKPAAPSPAVEAGPDKFFMAFGPNASLDAASPSEQKETSSKAKPAGKSSRFTSFFSQPPQDGRPRADTSTPLTEPPANGPAAAALMAKLGLGLGPTHAPGAAPPPEEERQAFQQLLAKLQKQSMSATPPGASPFAAPQQGNPLDAGKKGAITSPGPFQQYGGERREGPMGRPPPQQPREILAPRPQQQSARPDLLLQDLVGHHQRVSSQGSGRPEPNAARNNSNTEFLMNLMRAAPEAQRPEQQARMPQPQPQPHHKLGQMAPYSEREPEFPGRENRGAQRQMRPQPPPGFPMDESFHNPDQDHRPNQPTQILQRPLPPPGLDQMPPDWMARGGQMPPPQQRGPMIPPPGLAGGPNRNMPMPHMFPPSFPPGGTPPPPEAMGGMPPRNMPMPPPGFFAGLPPQGFMPPGLGGFNGPPGPDAHAFGGSPFEGRTPPSGGRGANYGRP
ncbi:hypothetical protein TOPH_05393 [Tolypocladium ophioglossoides CBS 100239]|uniref:Uncharacterized protein n=1 Tax=Tolypocladium ophioglossoides (strain CBS 100239) TaxID=1163406 RepID=A0A0L0N7L1_TOLOC|nr:hypothetical protein TOPH_05393 [Tolypocladium ophioglossoides CBS 100239]